MRQRDGRWLIAGETVFIQHGENYCRKSLAEAIGVRAREINRSIHTVLPDDPELWFNLDCGGEAVVREKRKNDLLHQMSLLQEELSRMELQSLRS